MDTRTTSLELSHTRRRYRELFLSAKEILFARLDGLGNGYGCPTCDASGRPELLAPLHPGCGYRDWQRAALHLIQSDVGGEILQKLREINRDRDKVKCHSSGVCCRLASSEFSWEELCEKAAAGDRFAGEFTSIFLPYADAEAARARFPDIVDDVLRYGRDPMGAPEGSINAAPVYFYHCPYIGEDNRCSVYGTPKRPDICATYPDTPLTFMYKKCAWKPWQERSHDEALLAHAMIELGSFLVDKLTQALAEDA